MNREIKFRAWRKDTKQMFDDIMFCDFENEKTVHEQSLNESIEVAQGTFFVLMQYTGLKDKNGKEIYEGDVVERYKGKIGSVEYGKYVTNNDENEDIFGWMFNDFTGRYWALDPQSNWKVIGNIYENHELLNP